MIWVEQRSRLDQVYDYLQSTVPSPSPTCTYASWFDTSTATEYVWVQGEGHWIATGMPSHVDWSTRAQQEADNTNLKFHEVFHNGVDRQWYPPFDAIVLGGFTSNVSGATDNFMLEVLVDNVVTATLGFGGANKYFTTDFDPRPLVDVDEGMSMRVHRTIPQVGEVEPGNVSAGIHYMRRIDG